MLKTLSKIHSFGVADVFHWKCLDKYARGFPANTAPAGYTCPSCKSCIFPAPNVASPVAETLRKVLIKVNWARAGLGLPLVSFNLFFIDNCVHILKAVKLRN